MEFDFDPLTTKVEIKREKHKIFCLIRKDRRSKMVGDTLYLRCKEIQPEGAEVPVTMKNYARWRDPTRILLERCEQPL